MRHDLRALDSEVFAIRNEAYTRLTELLVQHSDHNGYLDAEADANLRTFEEKPASPEQRGRIEMLRRMLFMRQESMPGRVSCDAGTYDDLRRALEKQLDMTIAVGSNQEALFEKQFDGVSSETSLTVLHRLCDESGCTPTLTSNGIVLNPREPGEKIRTSDKLCLIEKPDGSASVFYAPDKGFLLDIENTSRVEPSPYRFLNLLFFWRAGHRPEHCEDCPLQCELERPTQSLRTIVARSPVTVAMPVEQYENIRTNLQNIVITRVEQENCRTWSIIIRLNAEWFERNHFQNQLIQQLIEGNMYTALDTDGNNIPLKISEVTGSYGQYTVRIESETRPMDIRIRTYTRIVQECLQLPPQRDIAESPDLLHSVP